MINTYMKTSTSLYSSDERCPFPKNTSSLTPSYTSSSLKSSIFLKFFNENISLDEVVFTYIQPLLTLFSFQDILENLFPKKSDKKSNNKLHYHDFKNPAIQLILLFKRDYTSNVYQISSQLHYLYNLLEMNLHYQKFISIAKKKEKTIRHEINTTISIPSIIEPFHIHQKNALMSVKSPSFQFNNLNFKCNDFFGTWFVFCNLYCHDILLNYFTINVLFFYEFFLLFKSKEIFYIKHNCF